MDRQPQTARNQGAVTITLVPLADKVPAAVRLRRALKTLLRAYGLRCIRLEPKGGPP